MENNGGFLSAELSHISITKKWKKHIVHIKCLSGGGGNNPPPLQKTTFSTIPRFPHPAADPAVQSRARTPLHSRRSGCESI